MLTALPALTTQACPLAAGVAAQYREVNPTHVPTTVMTELESLSNGFLDAGPDAKFKWWLWLGNLGVMAREVLGDGVVSASLHNQASNVKHITFTRADSTQVTVELSLRSACHFKLRLMPTVSTS